MPDCSDPRSPPELTTIEEWRRVLKRLDQLERENERLRQRNAWLGRELEKALRAAQRQAAPFARRAPKEHPRKPGRKAGPSHGRPHWRPKPEQIDETLEAPLPPHCPHCWLSKLASYLFGKALNNRIQDRAGNRQPLSGFFHAWFAGSTRVTKPYRIVRELQGRCNHRFKGLIQFGTLVSQGH